MKIVAVVMVAAVVSVGVVVVVWVIPVQFISISKKCINVVLNIILINLYDHKY